MSSNSNLDLLSDDLLHQILVTATNNTYLIHGTVSKRFYEIYGKYNIPKQTYLYGYAPVEIINEMYEEEEEGEESIWHWLVKSDYDGVLKGVVHGIVEFKRDDLLQWSIEKSTDSDVMRYILRKTAEMGNLEAVQKIYNAEDEDWRKYLRTIGGVLGAAVKSDNMELVGWLLSEGFYPDVCALQDAIYNGNIEMLNFLHHTKGIQGWQDHDLVGALEISDDLSEDKRAEILQWIENNRWVIDIDDD